MGPSAPIDSNPHASQNAPPVRSSPEVEGDGAQGPHRLQEAKQGAQLPQGGRRLGVLRQRVGCAGEGGRRGGGGGGEEVKACLRTSPDCARWLRIIHIRRLRQPNGRASAHTPHLHPAAWPAAPWGAPAAPQTRRCGRPPAPAAPSPQPSLKWAGGEEEAWQTSVGVGGDGWRWWVWYRWR